MEKKDFLIEIGTEELPAKTLTKFSAALAENIKNNLAKEELTHGEIEIFATPRRLGVLIHDLITKQKPRNIERKGPAVQAAFDVKGNPTPATLGFARSCGVSVEQLQKQKTDKGEWLYFNVQQPGVETKKLLPETIHQSITTIPINRPMRWGSHSAKFIRPVHWVTMLFGEEPIDAHILGIAAKPDTHGHHFLFPDAIPLKNPREYSQKLYKTGKVIANFNERKENIRQQLKNINKKIGTVIIDEDLLDEVTGLVEWPVALIGNFETRFLEIPQEVLISAMKNHQKSFAVINEKKQLLPHFITISNIESKNPQRVIAGNERVMRARLSDAAFFYYTDLKHRLENRLENLKNVIFQTKLGSMYDKTQRIAKLASSIAENINASTRAVERASLIAKGDLLSEMVGEFPELQGIMGYYYALHDQESQEVATAIKEHYLPRFAGDVLPETLNGAALAIADRIDTIVGIFGINQAPTGEKDPFGLRRAALGILRIIIEKKLALDLKKLLQEAIKNYRFADPEISSKTFNFIMERLRAWYAEQNVTTEVFAAVSANEITQPLDFHHRIIAVQHFATLPEAKSLTAANKRVSNILKKENISALPTKINSALLTTKEEKTLADLLDKKSNEVEQLCKKNQYTEALATLAALQKPVDDFFDHVLVMVEDEKVKTNRLTLLMQLRKLFLKIADISLLQM